MAGHVIECGAQATGGNYSFFTEVPGLEHPGFPIAEVAADGSSVITKHPGTRRAVTVGTVTAQLLYEIGGPRYLNPDVVARFDTIELEQTRPRPGARSPASRASRRRRPLKVASTTSAGYRTTVTFGLTGLDIEAKAALVERTLWARSRRAGRVRLGRRAAHPHRPRGPGDQRGGRRAAADHGEGPRRAQGRTGLQRPRSPSWRWPSYPGFFGWRRRRGRQAYGVYWPALVPADLVWQEVVVNGERAIVESTTRTREPVVVGRPDASRCRPCRGRRRAPLGRVVGARSGDKGGNANLGVWARSDDGVRVAGAFLTVERLRELLPETRALEVERYPLPNIRALNFVIHGLLGEGVASSTRRRRAGQGPGRVPAGQGRRRPE